MNLADSRMDCLRGCLATLSVLVVRISLLDHSKIHEKAYKCIVYELSKCITRCVRPRHPYIESLPTL